MAICQENDANFCANLSFFYKFVIFLKLILFIFIILICKFKDLSMFDKKESTVELALLFY